MMSGAALERERLRRNFSNPSYDPISFLFAQTNNEVSLETTDLEGRLFSYFDRITSDITDLTNEIESEIYMLQRNALSTETFLLEELDEQSQKLIDVENAVEEVKEDFQSASDGAVRVGNKLANSERERLNIKKSIDLMKYIKEFEHAPEGMYSDVLKMNAEKLRETLPEALRTQDWYYLSQVLYDLKKILFDINSEDVQKAQQVVINITEVVEMELLGQFDVLLDELMENQENPGVIGRARTLAECLHLFNNGQSLHKRYIFSVVEKRIPSDAFLESHKEKDNLFTKVTRAIKKHGRKLKLPPGLDALAAKGQFDEDDEASDASSSGASASDDEESDRDRETFLEGIHQYQAGDSSLQLLDHLSRLFTMINRVCVEQFSIIKKVFPTHTIPRVTRQLIQRIFNDPAFGIQARIDAILNPQPPAPALSLSDYLDALLTVREKLSALNVLLLECAADASMIGMGSEVLSMRKAKKEIAAGPSGPRSRSGSGRSRAASRVSINLGTSAATHALTSGSSPVPTGAGGATADALAELYLEDQEHENEEKLKSDAEIRDFFYEQSSQVLVNYLHDYFDKETMHVRNQYVALLRKAVDEHGPPANGQGKVSAGTVLQLPHFRAERMKSIEQIAATVANRKFLDSIFNVTTDAVTRMESIGRDDKKLPNHVKDLYLLQLGFIAEGLMLPWAKASITMLLRLAGSKPQNSALPSIEALPSLVALTYGKHRLNTHFNDIFQRPLSASPNLIAACKEAKKKYFALIRRTANEMLFAWTLCVAAHFDKLWLSLQGKYDYNPILDGLGAAAAVAVAAVATNNNMNALLAGPLMGGKSRFNFNNVTGPTAACDAVCKAFIQVTHAMRRYEQDFVDFDLNSLFWRPMGQQFVGVLIAHLRRQTISIDGARQLRRDLEEYRHVTALMNSAETSDMIVCLEEIVSVFEATSGEDVVRVVTEELRHLDTAVVLGLVRVRADFNSVLTGSNSSWAKALSSKYLNYKWDTTMPWEGRKAVTIVSFREAMNSAYSTKMGPKTLRRSGNAMPNVYINEAMRLRHLLPPPPPKDDPANAFATAVANSAPQGSRTISLDLRALETGHKQIIERHIREAELQALEAQQQQQLTGSDEQQRMSRFLPTRPDEETSFGNGKNGAINDAANGNAARTVSTNGMGYAGPNALPQRRASGPNTANPASNGQSAGGNSVSSPTVKNMFQKVTSFFR